MTAYRPRKSRRPRGFAAIFAISLIILVGSSLIVLGNYFATEATRTRAQQDEAQLRQLLAAGAAIAVVRADHPAAGNAAPLPPSLAENASLTIDLSGEGDDRTAVIRARLGDRRREQTVKLHRSAGRWHVQ